MPDRLLIPRRLQPGDTIGLLAPASAPPDWKRVEAGIAALEKLGFKTKLARHAKARLGFLAGSDRDRAADLMSLFADKLVTAIMCLRGGYGSARLLDRLDYSVIRRNPKIFIGFSDITSLHCAFLNEAGLVSFHGPMVNSDFAEATLPPVAVNSFLRTLTQPAPAGDIALGYRKRTVKTLRGGVTRGRLIGGNLSLLCTTLGTRWQPEFRGRLLFLEDLGEEPYRFDRMLTHLLNAGVLPQVAGVAIGLNHNCEDPKRKRGGQYRQSLEDVMRERLLGLKVPVVAGLPFGHVPHNATLPIGLRAELDANAGRLSILEPAVV
ncbi:MAG: LD-carboxypeptidase [Verrucomicrobia bacterium]|nr:MAG: LD-carboxypeptidase [Verrucomicrobiota bacterium]